MREHKIAIDDRGLAAVLAGLRMLQREVEGDWIDQEIHDIYSGAGSFVGLDSDEIDELCEQLNMGE